jgi:hypothetical protein
MEVYFSNLGLVAFKKHAHVFNLVFKVSDFVWLVEEGNDVYK